MQTCGTQAMNLRPPSDPPPPEERRACHQGWTPPSWLLEVAPDDESVIVELIDVFKTATETSLQQMRSALAAVDVPRLKTEAHRTKGSARQVGADALAEICQALELASSQTSLARLAELLDRGQQVFAETGNAMTSYSEGRSVGRTGPH